MHALVSRALPAVILSSITITLGIITGAGTAAAQPALQLPWPTGDQHRIYGGNTYNCDTHTEATNTDHYNADKYGIDFQFGLVDGSPLDIAAVAGGTVIYRDNNRDGYGNKVIINHGGNYYSIYAHLREGNTWGPGIVEQGPVRQGQIVGYAGDTGGNYPVHLHMHMMSGQNAHVPEPMSGISNFGQWGHGENTGLGCQFYTDASPYWYPDLDGDGYGDGDEVTIGTSVYVRCGVADTIGPSEHWPSDLLEGAFSPNKINVIDIADFISPVRRMNTSPGHPNFRSRNDLQPGPAPGVSNWIGIEDMAAIITSSRGYPPMFGGQKAYDGSSCTGD
jgi:murein DD-endopeptidase MepM/ murein hydrolase activator NlpD